jgi:hypothetical protein
MQKYKKYSLGLFRTTQENIALVYMQQYKKYSLVTKTRRQVSYIAG